MISFLDIECVKTVQMIFVDLSAFGKPVSHYQELFFLTEYADFFYVSIQMGIFLLISEDGQYIVAMFISDIVDSWLLLLLMLPLFFNRCLACG